MQQTETHTHSFIVKIWLEETVAEDGRAIWRGHITHVPDGERRYFRQLSDITTIIMPYLSKMGVQVKLSARLRQWIVRLIQ